MESNKYIVVKFSELSLKGGNKKEFISTLFRNIKQKLEDKEIIADVKTGRDKIEIRSDKQLEDIPAALDEVVGISLYSHVIECEPIKEVIENIIEKELLGKVSGKTFRVSAKLINNDIFANKEDMIK